MKTTHNTTPETSQRLSAQALALADLGTAELEDMLLSGQTPELRTLAGWDYCGLNINPFAKVFGVRKFIKGFELHGDQVIGFNCPAKQGSAIDSWQALPSEREPRRFGYFAVTPVDAATRDNKYLHAVLLNYREQNSLLSPTRGLRDYLVQVYPGNKDLFLGKAYYALGPVRVFASFFLLQRRRQL